MHELLLFASVPAHQHHELLQQLAGLTAMQPRHRLERRLVFKAYRKPGLVTTRVGASQDVQGADLQRLNKMLNGGMYYTQVVGPVTKADFGATSLSAMSASHDADVSMSGTDQSSYCYENQPWKLEFRDIPEAGTRSAVTTRLMASASLPKGDIAVPMNAWGYSFVTEYMVEGDVFVQNDIVIFLHRVLLYPQAESQDLHGPRRQLPAYHELTPLERTGSYVLQAAITVQDGSNQEMMKTASQHLFGLREQLKSAVRLEQADRLSLDTRAK
ncbi:mediator of RNA polymerase II transcription subunit 18 [Aspergillus brunneoviolaceus CBS 621.78]|uniref:Mediator of RNA polymerase II transcription subunit 18 n=2 Tax=Aspergillus TaxID=5052 RepID=A0A8G1RYR4_9EURO|nr:RNA polymerase II mediator complex subunit Srb5 [Aspergillus brunneoviolaceus CBS 621.78]XP_040806442.1 RNA polymerase II mediator complex subunit Srb5 [Aspergillus fijiensis CBS 313.89]RAH44378.1 RNA polymerase II mediator complex subunit Srb5 [Aspergillus brunneoviolaceus CBS 621.78]RAK82432.1 RNA polymerase II mediator complex subunit Srb5 [Aspergillus fijiensis CBS 313.89]